MSCKQARKWVKISNELKKKIVVAIRREPRESSDNNDRGLNASSEPLIEMSGKEWDYEALPEVTASVILTPTSTPPTTQKLQSTPRVYFQAENLASIRRRSSSRQFASQSSYRRRSRSMSAWSDLSRASFKFEER